MPLCLNECLFVSIAMGQRDLLTGDDNIQQGLLTKKQSTQKSRFSASSDKGAKPSVAGAVGDDHPVQTMTNSEAMAAPPSSSDVEFNLDKKWILDPNLLRVGSKIGEGSHGKVYEGRYKDMSVAIKVIQKAQTADEQKKLEARFAREAEIMSKVKHKNLVKFIGACKDPVMAITTELLPGRSLRKLLLSLRPNQLDLYVAVHFALDIAHAMNCLHSNGIIHRDLKPENLLLTADQKSVKLVDFGLAREESLTEMMTAETGTYRWMAPELYSSVTLRLGDKKYYNKKVDVYSFAIVLWELVTNKMPFEGMSNLQAAYAAAFKNARPSIPDGLPEDLVHILQTCWAEDPNERPNFGQVISMLTSLLATLPSPATNGFLSILGNMKESVRGMLWKDDLSDHGSLGHHKDDYSDGGSPAKSKRRFLCFGHCFASDKGERLVQ